MNPLIFLMLLFTVSGLVLIGISIPLIHRRTKRTLISGVITTTAAIVLYLIPGLTVDGYALGMTFFGLGPLTIGIAQSLQYLKQSE